MQETAYSARLDQLKRVGFDEAHPVMLKVMQGLAEVYYNQGKYWQAEKLYKKVLSTPRRSHDEFGSIDDQLHYDICSSLIELARVFEGQDQLEEAVKIYRVSSERAKLFLGDAHHTTMFSNSCLGRVLRRQGLLQESEELLMATAVRQIKTFGEDHQAPLVTIYDLGETLRTRGKYQDAATWLKKSFQRSRAIFGPDYNLTMGSCDSLGLCYEKQGLYVEARALYQELMDKLRVAKGDDHPRISEVQGWIDEVNRKVDEHEGDEGNEGRGRLLPGLVSIN
ncbi:hypothetical protein V8E51_002620 [Hyaloscypha variabilis]